MDAPPLRIVILGTGTGTAGRMAACLFANGDMPPPFPIALQKDLA